MITIGLFAIVAFIFAWRMFRKEYRFERAVFSFIIALIGTFAGGLAAVVISQVSVDSSVRWDRTANIELVSLNRDSKLQGRFFLGTGELNQKEYYYFYKRAQDGGYKPGKIAISDSVTIYEEERRDGLIEVYECYGEKKESFLIIYFGLPFTDSCGKAYHFRIPTGSLKRDFLLD